MSGHSKWAQIKHQKATADLKRGKIFSKLASAITLASRIDSNPESNPQLRLLVEKAKSVAMPKENIERAIKRGSSQEGGAQLEEVMLEAYGPKGSAIIIQAASDNKNRTISELKHILSYHNVKPAEPGSVIWMFKEVGIIVFIKENWNEELSLKAIELGATDIEENDEIIIKTNPKDLNTIKEELGKIVSVEDFSLSWESNQIVTLSDEDEKQNIQKLFEELDEHNDVVEVYSNIDFV